MSFLKHEISMMALMMVCIILANLHNFSHQNTFTKLLFWVLCNLLCVIKLSDALQNGSLWAIVAQIRQTKVFQILKLNLIIFGSFLMIYHPNQTEIFGEKTKQNK